MARKIIEKAVDKGIFKQSHLDKLDKYSDAGLISYALTYMSISYNTTYTYCVK